jgi:ATP-dependent Clp protease adapter protein ClpS
MSQSHPDRSPVPRLPDEASSQGRPLDQPRTQQLPRYKVLLHPDAVHDLMFVVRSVMELTRFPRAEATHKMWEAHHCGRSVLLITHRERAELFVEQFASRGLTVSIEPA